MAHIESVPLKQLTKKEALALSKKFHKQTIAFLKMMKRLDRLSKRKPKHPIYFNHRVALDPL